MSLDHSVTQWIAALKDGDEEAAHRLWGMVFERMVQVARSRLDVASRSVADEEDVALSAFKSLCGAAARGRLEQMHDRKDLWRLLMRITANKVVNHRRHYGAEKRGGGTSSFRVSDNIGFEHIAGSEPTPDFVAVMEEEYEQLLGQLRDDMLRRIAVARMEGWTNREIADELGVEIWTVERKLKLIRKKWSTELKRE